MIKLMKFYATNGTVKVKCGYYQTTTKEGQEYVTIYAKEYGNQLSKLFDDGVQNDTDYMTDYFDKDRVRIFPGNPLWEAANARAKPKQGAVA